MFQFSGSSYLSLCIQYRLTGYCPAGFPHSDIYGSMLICSSPQLIAAYHVLLRLLMPRHSPCALLNLTFKRSLVLLSDLIMWVSLLILSKNSFIPSYPWCIFCIARSFWKNLIVSRIFLCFLYLLFSLFSFQTAFQPAMWWLKSRQWKSLLSNSYLLHRP